MEHGYWLARKRSAMAMACGASSAEARLIHYDLAGRYSVLAAQALPPFMLPAKAPPVAEGERAVLPPLRPPLRPPPPAAPRAPGERS
jgi:hypothetical protein